MVVKIKIIVRGVRARAHTRTHARTFRCGLAVGPVDDV